VGLDSGSIRQKRENLHFHRFLNGCCISQRGLHQNRFHLHPFDFTALVTPLSDYEVNRQQSCLDRKLVAISLTSILLDAFATQLALDLTAPVKLTAALPAARVQTRIVTPPAAHRVAVVRRRRDALARCRHGPVAATAARAQRHGRRIQFAVAGRHVEVDEVTTHRLLVGRRRATRRPSSQSQKDGPHGALAADRFHASSVPIASRQ